MKRKLLTLLAIGMGASALAVPFKYVITPDHTNHLYHCGEQASFRVIVNETNNLKAVSGKVKAHLDNFGGKEIAAEEWDLAKGNVFTISATLKEPGFLRLRLSDGYSDRHWSVGFDPEAIVKGSPSPANFDKFWAKARAELAAKVPLDPQLKKIPERSTPHFDFYRISFATWGRRVHGYMTVPTDRKRAPYPVQISVAAAGFGDWTNNTSGDSGKIKVFFSVYPFEPDWQWNEKGLNRLYDEMNANYKKEYGTIYSCAGIVKGPKEYFFYPVILGIDRAIDWVAKRPNVDLKHFRYEGTSQGGAFGFYLCGLNHHFTRALFFVPACTDTMGVNKGRQSGWPYILESQPNPAARAAAARWAPYFDGANFASRITCPVRVVVGFSDTTCAPCAVYASFNEIKVKDKGIKHCFGMGHGFNYGDMGDVLNWLNEKERNR